MNTKAEKLARVIILVIILVMTILMSLLIFKELELKGVIHLGIILHKSSNYLLI